MGFDFSDLEIEFARRIAALSGVAYAQGARLGTWRESSTPLSVTDQPNPIGHLTFNVFVENGRNSTRARDNVGGDIKFVSDVIVLISYHIRPADSQIADMRLASKAAIDTARALLALPQADFVVDLVNAWRPAVTADGEWMLIRQDFTVKHEVSI